MKSKWRHRTLWVLGALTVSVFGGSMAAKGGVANSCVVGEFLEMNDPMVTVIEGPGNPVSEQVQWSSLNYAYLEGPSTITLGDTEFKLERVP